MSQNLVESPVHLLFAYFLVFYFYQELPLNKHRYFVTIASVTVYGDRPFLTLEEGGP